MDISEEDRALIADHLARGEPLPDRFRFSLFREAREAELIWPGKTHEVTQAILPFQSIEQIDEPRAEAHVTHDLFSRDAVSGRQAGGWSNKLIWGDNKLVLSSLKGGPLRRQIEDAGGLKLVYIDPPFDVGADFSFRIQVGDESLTKEPSVIEDVAYRDTWGRGKDSYVAMLSERFHSIHDLLAADGSVFVHVDERMSPFVRMLLDERFGSENYINTITWKRSDAHSDAGQGAKHFGRVTDHILYYSRTPDAQILNMQYSPLSAKTADKWYRHIEEGSGRRYNKADITGPGGAVKGNPVFEWNGVTRAWRFSRNRMQELHDAGRVIYSSSGQAYLKRYLDESKGIPIQDLWDDIGMIRGIHTNSEAVGYATQKPEGLLERVIQLGSNPGDLVADFFCGSGTTLAVAEKLGRKWIGCDLGRFAIHTSRKRLIGVQRQLKTEAKPYRSFEILNLGKYERQYFVGIDPTLPEVQRRAISAEKEARYVNLILTAYSAQAVEQTPPFHGRKQGAFVLVGPVDAPVVEGQITEAVDAARRLGAARVDVLGFEFEMGLNPRVTDEARAKGVQLALRYIPKDVFDRRAVEKGQVSFHDLAYVEAKATVVSKRDRSVTVSLTDFGVSYRQEDVEAMTAGMKAGSKVTVDQGQVVKVTKAKSGEVTREVLTKAWTDWIDYWAVDFDYASRPETIVVTEADASGRMMDRPQWTGGYIFENEWQAFRTRRDRTLELTSAPHEYPRPGRYRIAVKVIDIFGNDTTKVIGVDV